MQNVNPKIVSAVTEDIRHGKSIGMLLNVASEAHVGGRRLTDMSIGTDALCLVNGLKFPASMSHEMFEACGGRSREYLQFVKVLGDSSVSSDETMKNLKHGIIMYSAPDVRRTNVIKKWSSKLTYLRSPRGDAFKEAVETMGLFAKEHISTYNSIAKAIGVTVCEPALGYFISGKDDYRAVFGAYRALIFECSADYSARTHNMRAHAKEGGFRNLASLEKAIKEDNRNIPDALKTLLLIQKLAKVALA